MIERIEQLDRNLFLFLNGLHQDWLDPIMIGLSNPFFSLPVYFLVFYFIKIKFGWKVTLWAILALILVVILCDGISYRIFKQGFERYRPCYNLEIGDQVYLPTGSCGGKFSFVSGHATNFFGLATFWGMLLMKRVKMILPVLLIWAGLIAYSRIYLGVHYPADIACGALLGIFLGWLVYRFFKNVMLNFNWIKA